MPQLLYPIIALCALSLTSGHAADRTDDANHGFFQDESIGTLDVVLGIRQFEGDFDEFLDEEAYAAGLQYQMYREGWVVGVSGGITWIEGDNSDLGREVKGQEYHLGVYRPFSYGKLDLEIGGGAIVYDYDFTYPLPGTVNATGLSTRQAVGVYVQAAMRYTFGRGFDVGLIGRYGYSDVEAPLTNEDDNPGGVAALLSLGLRF